MSKPIIEIIKLSADEWGKYRELRLRALTEEPQAFGSSYEESVKYPETKWRERLTGKWIQFAKIGEKLVGMVTAYQERDEAEKLEANVASVFVVAEARGMGVASKLLTEILELLKQEGIKTAKLGVIEEQKAAINLYRKFGFEEVGREKSKTGDGVERVEIMMEKRLD